MNDCNTHETPLVFTPFCDPQTRETYLLLDLPAERKDEWAFYCNDEYDLPVPDARIVINAQALADALLVYSQHSETFGSVSIRISIDSDGYEGKLRHEELKITMARYIDAFYSDIEFTNDWTGSTYWLDADSYWPVPNGEMLAYLADLLDNGC